LPDSRTYKTEEEFIDIPGSFPQPVVVGSSPGMGKPSTLRGTRGGVSRRVFIKPLLEGGEQLKEPLHLAVFAWRARIVRGHLDG
jgi:hypothetical protein